jgi:parallel beta-helix repeat protein
MNGKLILNALAIFFLILGIVTTTAGAAVITVDSNGGENYTSIQEAVNNAQNGDTILVNPGVYRENIKVDKEISIISKSASEDKINYTYVMGAVLDKDIFSVESNNVTISGFYILGGPSSEEWYEAGIYLNGADNCSLSNNALIFNDVGIAINDSQRNYIDNNLVSLGYSGIFVVGSSENELSDNWLATNGEGILLNNSVNNTIFNNTASANGVGIYLGTSGSNMVVSNLISKNNYGIIGERSEYNSITGNSLYHNMFGIYFNESSNNTVYQNEFLNFHDALDEGINIWNSSSAGNLWSDYTGIDANGDGIGDTPFVINETTGSTDYMPLVNENSSKSNSASESNNVNEAAVSNGKTYVYKDVTKYKWVDTYRYP